MATETDDWDTGSSSLDYQYALEVQEPWGSMILSKRKTIETRRYPLPPKLLNQRILLLGSPAVAGDSRLSQMGDTVIMNPGDTTKIIGWCIFDDVKTYTDRTAFQDEENLHCVSSDSKFAWSDQSPVDRIYGWRIKLARPLEQRETEKFVKCVRKMRSLFRVLTK